MEFELVDERPASEGGPYKEKKITTSCKTRTTVGMTLDARVGYLAAVAGVEGFCRATQS